MSILWWIGYAVMAWGAFDLIRRAVKLWKDSTSGPSIYNDPDTGRF